MYFYIIFKYNNSVAEVNGCVKSTECIMQVLCFCLLLPNIPTDFDAKKQYLRTE